MGAVESGEPVFKLRGKLAAFRLTPRCQADNAVHHRENVRDTVLNFARNEFGTLFSMPSGRDIDMSSAEQQRSPVAVALDLSLGKNPMRLTVAWTNDAILDFVVRRSSADSFEEVRNDAISIVRMNPRNPIFMRLMGRFERQAVNRKILRRPRIAELAAPQIHCQPADVADLLNASKLQLAFRQSRLYF